MGNIASIDLMLIPQGMTMDLWLAYQKKGVIILDSSKGVIPDLSHLNCVIVDLNFNG